MPTTTDLDRLAALLTVLAPLRSTQPGTLIKADDWNTVVDAVIQLGRALLAESRTDTVGVHEHTDQVQLSWLDGRLRGLLQEGPLSDPASSARVAELERRITRTGSAVDDVRTSVDGVRDRVSAVADRDLIRESDVTNVRRVVEAMSDSRDDVLELRSSLDAVRGDLTRAIDVGKALIVDGVPLDVAGLVGRVGSLEDLRSRLTLPDGGLLDAKALERRLTELTNTLVTEQELDDALGRVKPRISDDQVLDLREKLRTETASQIETSVGTLRADFDSRIDQRLGDVDGRVSGKVNDALPALREQLLTDARALTEEAVARGSEQTKALVEQRLADATQVLRGDVTTRLAEARGEILAAAGAAARAELGDAVGTLSTQLESTRARADAASAKVDGLGGSVSAQATSLAQLTAGMGDLERRLSTQVTDAFDRARAESQQLVEQARAQLRDVVVSEVTSAVRARVDDSVTALRQEMRQIARDEVGTVRTGLDARIDEQVNVRMDRAVEALPRQIAADFERNGPMAEVMGRMIDQRVRR